MRYLNLPVALLALTMFIGCGQKAKADDPSQPRSFSLAGSGEPLMKGLSASPDGTRIAFYLTMSGAMGEMASSRLVTFNLQTRQCEFYNEPLGIGSETPRGASWSPDSQKLAFTFVESESGNPSGYNVWLLHLDTGAMARLVRHPSEDLVGGPRLSPDGTRLLVRAGSPGNIAVAEVATQKCSFLLGQPQEGPRIALQPYGYDWAPDGKTAYISMYHPDPAGLGYYSSNTSGAGIWSIDVTTGERTLLTDDYEAYVLSTSPSGDYLAFYDAGRPVEAPSLYVVRLKGFQVQKICDKGEPWTSWSQTGDRLAFCDSVQARIMVWSPSAKQPKGFPIRKGKPEYHYPAWIGSSDSLAFITDAREIWKLDVTSGEQELLITASDALKAQAPSEE